MMKHKEKTLIREGPNLSSIAELLGFGSKNPTGRMKNGEKIGYRWTNRRTGLMNSIVEKISKFCKAFATLYLKKKIPRKTSKAQINARKSEKKIEKENLFCVSPEPRPG
jgi:hypothetical protein